MTDGQTDEARLLEQWRQRAFAACSDLRGMPGAWRNGLCPNCGCTPWAHAWRQAADELEVAIVCRSVEGTSQPVSVNEFRRELLDKMEVYVITKSLHTKQECLDFMADIYREALTYSAQPPAVEGSEAGASAQITTKEQNMETIQIASVCHEANRAYCLTQGDVSQLPWADAPEWQRSSAIVGVEKALKGATPEQLHESWSAQKVAEGWVYGDVKDADAKTHPCLVPYPQLPAEQQRKDALFGAIVDALR